MDKISDKLEDWKKSDVHVFWGEIAPCDHVVQIYENDEAFLSTLEDFAFGGLSSGDSVIIIGTEQHIAALNSRLATRHLDLNALMANDQYFPLDAKEVLSKFMVNDWPDEALFHSCINEVISRAGRNNRKVRAFGEMVAVLWSEGKNGATVQLENLWNQLHAKDQFTLYCAYPKTGFTQSPYESVDKICKTHARIIDGKPWSSTEIYYKNA